MRIGLALCALGALVAGLLAPVLALASERVCGERTHIVQRLAEAYGETRQSMGLQQGSRVVELFASTESGTWTILVTLPSGLTCLVAAGEAWDREPQQTRLPGRPS